MLERLRILLAKHLYRKDTNYLLNLMTLSISDSQIREEYFRKRTQRYNNLFWPLVVLVIAVQISNIVRYFTVEGVELARALRPANYLLIVLIMAAARYFCPRF
jgi:hypothetical protein